MSKEFFKVKKGINLDPISSSSVSSPEVGDIIVDSSDNNKLKRYDGVTASWKDVGSGVGGINYISTNSDFEGGTTGYAIYANTVASVSPETGTGGSPNPAFTFTATTSSPLRGTKSGLITKDTASRQGHGVSYDFDIDSADQAQILRISFDYSTSTNYADGDVRIYVYDVFNSRLIEVVDRDLYGSSFGKFVGTFQTSPDSTSYRLIFHVASISALAYTVKIDNVIVGPQTIVKGAIVTDWESFTPALNSTTNITPTGYWRRVGSDAEFSIRLDFTGAGASVSLTMSLPNGLSIDTTKIPTLTDQVTRLDSTGVFFDASGAGTANHFDVAAFSLAVQTGFRFWVNQADDWRQFNPASVPVATAAGDVLFISVKIPVLGWSSNMVLSEDAGNREIVFKSALQNPTSATFDGTNNLIFPASLIDTAAGYNSSTGVYTIPESGIYYVKGSVLIGGTEANNNKLELRIYNGATIINVGANTIQNSGLVYQQVNASTLYQFNKGDTVSLRVLTEITSPSIISGVQYHTFEIAKRSSPQTIAASEVVAMRATTITPLAIGTTATDVKFDDVTLDTHNSYNATTGIFTAPQSGYYQINVSTRIASTTLTSTQFILLQILTTITETRNIVYGNGSANQYEVTASCVAYVAKGGSIQQRLQSSVATTLNTTAAYSTLSICKISGVS